MNIKKTVIFALKAAVFIAALVPFMAKLGQKYAVASTENKINTYNECRWNDFYALPKNSLDVVFLGSSHSYCTFDPEIFDEALGTSSFQMGMPLQHMDTTYYTLLEVLNYQHPKCVVLEVYWDMMDDEFELTQAGYLFQVMKNEELKKQYITQVFPPGERIKYAISAFRYQTDYFAFKSSDMKKKIELKFDVETPAAQKQVGQEYYRSKGCNFCDYKMLPDEFDKTNQYRELDGKKWKLNDTQKKYLLKLTDKCKEEGIDIIWVTAPVANVSMDYIKNYDLIYGNFEKLAIENKVTYIDYNRVNKEKKLLTNDNFRDDAHLNNSGIAIIDREFLPVLEEHLKKSEKNSKFVKKGT